MVLGHEGQVDAEVRLRSLELSWVAQVRWLLEVVVVVQLHLPLGPTEVVRIGGVPGAGEVILGQAKLTRAGRCSEFGGSRLAWHRDRSSTVWLRCVVARGVRAGGGIQGRGPG